MRLRTRAGASERKRDQRAFQEGAGHARPSFRVRRLPKNPKGDGKAGYYVGMTGLSPEKRFANHKAGIKAAGCAPASV